MPQTYINEIKEIAYEMGYDILNDYFSEDNAFIWLEYRDMGLSAREAIVRELGE